MFKCNPHAWYKGLCLDKTFQSYRDLLKLISFVLTTEEGHLDCMDYALRSIPLSILDVYI